METSVHEWIGTCSSDKCGVSNDRWKHSPSISPDPELDQFNFKMRDCRDCVFVAAVISKRPQSCPDNYPISFCFLIHHFSSKKDSIILSHFFNCSVSLSVTDRQLSQWYQYVLVGQRRRFQRWKRDFRLLLPDTFCHWDQFLFYVFSNYWETNLSLAIMTDLRFQRFKSHILFNHRYIQRIDPFQ